MWDHPVLTCKQEQQETAERTPGDIAMMQRATMMLQSQPTEKTVTISRPAPRCLTAAGHDDRHTDLRHPTSSAAIASATCLRLRAKSDVITAYYSLVVYTNEAVLCTLRIEDDSAYGLERLLERAGITASDL